MNITNTTIGPTKEINQTKLALASTLFVSALKKQTLISTRHSRVRRGREMKAHHFRVNENLLTQVPKTSPQVNIREKKKEKVQHKLNKSLEQGLNLSGS